MKLLFITDSVEEMKEHIRAYAIKKLKLERSKRRKTGLARVVRFDKHKVLMKEYRNCISGGIRNGKRCTKIKY